jgi:2-phosphosulfolactate phosphatase
VVDVLRFTTAVDAGVSRGGVVIPCRWNVGTAQEFARQMQATLADPGDPSGPSLSPISLRSLQPGDRVVLPSPNGSSCAVAASENGATVVASCLRNVSAVAEWVNSQGVTVAVIACGERWPDDSLRPSLEDHLGAGALISALNGSKSMEAECAAQVWEANCARVSEVVASCVSGREAIQRGWREDLDYAIDVDVSRCVPVLRNGGFVDAAAVV